MGYVGVEGILRQGVAGWRSLDRLAVFVVFGLWDGSASDDERCEESPVAKDLTEPRLYLSTAVRRSLFEETVSGFRILK